jgi:hypothetical protein
MIAKVRHLFALTTISDSSRGGVAEPPALPEVGQSNAAKQSDAENPAHGQPNVQGS